MTLGTVVAVLVLLLLLALLLLPRGRQFGSGTGRGSAGTGSGTASGDGTGAAADSDSVDASGSDSSPGESTAGPEHEPVESAGTSDSESPPEPRRAERASPQPMPPEPFEIGALPESVADPETADDSAAAESSGGAGGGGGAAGRAGGQPGNSSEFFGVKSKGRRFVYIVDQSGSMHGNRFVRACDELLDAINGLTSRQSFYVYFFTESERPMFDDATGEPKMIRATAANKRRIREWVATLYAGGGNGAEAQSILDAVKLKPDAIYFLSDGGFDPNTADWVREDNSKPPVPVNTIGFEDRSYEELLEEIARDSGGKYRFVP